MNKVIKFRAWDGQAMRYGGFSVHATAGKIEPLAGLSTVTEESPLMQFTGSLDKHGREIYEGDIIAAKDITPLTMLNEELYPPSEPLVVRWCGGSYTPWFVVPNELVEIEIIGNIHEDRLEVDNE